MEYKSTRVGISCWFKGLKYSNTFRNITADFRAVSLCGNVLPWMQRLFIRAHVPTTRSTFEGLYWNSSDWIQNLCCSCEKCVTLRGRTRAHFVCIAVCIVVKQVLLDDKQSKRNCTVLCHSYMIIKFDPIRKSETWLQIFRWNEICNGSFKITPDRPGPSSAHGSQRRRCGTVSKL